MYLSHFVFYEEPELHLPSLNCFSCFLSFAYRDDACVCAAALLASVLNVFYCESCRFESFLETLAPVPLGDSQEGNPML